MDLSTSDYVATLNQGARLELRHPGTGKRFTEHGGNSLFVHVLGIDADAVEKAKKEAGRALMKAAKNAETETVKYEVEIACAAVTAFEGGSGNVETLDDFRQFMRTHPDGKFFARQINAFAENTAGFFAAPQNS